MATKVATKNEITLKGSVDIVSEFFVYSINSILYQRGIYPPETFKRASKYGLSMLVTNDDGLKEYLNSVLSQLSDWLVRGDVQKLVVVITGSESEDVLERWVFNVETATGSEAPDAAIKHEKPLKDIQKEIQAIIRQITASISFLPLLEEPCTFDLLVYTNPKTEVPALWIESDPKYIQNSAEVRLRSFTTKIHKVDAMVAYKKADDDDV